MVHFCSKFLSEQMLMSLSAQLCRRYPVGHYTGADSPIRPHISARVCAGALKMTDMKLQDMKMADQIAGHENARHEIDGPSSRA